MSLDRDDTIKKLDAIEIELANLAKSIDDRDYVNNPIKVSRYITDTIQTKMKLVGELDKNLIYHKNQLENQMHTFNNCKNSRNTTNEQLSALADKINKYENELESISSKLDNTQKEIDMLKNMYERIQNDKNYIEYKSLFLKRYALQRQLNIEQDDVTKDIKSLRQSANNNSFSMSNKMLSVLQNESKWYEQFKTRLGFSLKQNSDNLLGVEFVSKNNSTIIVKDKTVSAVSDITDENKSELAPAMIALFLKCTENSGMNTCDIDMPSKEIFDYFENMLANELLKRSPSNANYKINDIFVSDILARNKTQSKINLSTEDKPQSEIKTENETPSTSNHFGA